MFTVSASGLSDAVVLFVRAGCSFESVTCEEAVLALFNWTDIGLASSSAISTEFYLISLSL